MKRSEALKTLESAIDELINVTRGSVSSYQLADLILTKIELIGMEPPKIQKYVIPDGRPEFGYMEYLNRWEKENDKK